MIEAAVAGLGVCLGSDVLARAMLRDGRLVVMSDVALSAGRPFYAVTLERNLRREWVRTFWDWLLDAAPQFEEEASSG